MHILLKHILDVEPNLKSALQHGFTVAVAVPDSGVIGASDGIV